MTSAQSDTVNPPQPPPLEKGDRLSRAEFEQRYSAMPTLKKAELIEGVVHLRSPLQFEPHANLMTWLGNYKIFTPKVRLGDNPKVRLDLHNEPQPDAVLLIDPKAGGRSHFSDDGYVEGAPELIAEIAPGAAIDLSDRTQSYLRNGVQEYLVWQVGERQLNWLSLQEEKYVPIVADPQGVIRSQIFPGLWLAASDLLAGNMQQVLAVLQAGLNSDEHQRFVHQLASQISSD